MNKIFESIITDTDSYKFSQWLQYPEGTTHVSSYIESRGGEEETVFFGLQYILKEYLEKPITIDDVEFANSIITEHGLPFNYDGWMSIVKDKGYGYLPIEITAVPEGTVMAPHNVQLQITNTVPGFGWLVSYLETLILSGVWYPSTVATKSRKMKKIIQAAINKSGSGIVDFKLHDFGSRGCSSRETAKVGGMAHLVNFKGTDTFIAIPAVMKYYNTTEVVGYSIPASEHSTITSWGKANEVNAFSNMIDKFSGENKIYACVSDSYDIMAACDTWGTTLKNKIIYSGGTLVVRPDSGDPLTVPVDVIKRLMYHFGYSFNEKGFKVLPSYVRVIQGDGLNEHTLPALINNILNAGLSIDNIAFGMGGGLLQAWNRDTLKYAMKASAIRINNGPWIGFSKDPITDHGKKSKEGRLALIKENGVFKTVPETSDSLFKNELKQVFFEGKLVNETTFNDVRARSEGRL